MAITRNMHILKINFGIYIIAATTLILCSACDYDTRGTNILDAASLYAENMEEFSNIISSYPLPIAEFTRIPSRDPAKESEINRQFLKKLRKKISIEHIDFFPRSNSGTDEINVVIGRFGANAEWTVISLIYVSRPLSPQNLKRNMALFDKCDQRSIDWIEAYSGSRPIYVFCQVDEKWYAHQKVG